jgi:hypothetical protein
MKMARKKAQGDCAFKNNCLEKIRRNNFLNFIDNTEIGKSLEKRKKFYLSFSLLPLRHACPHKLF